MFPKKGPRQQQQFLLLLGARKLPPRPPSSAPPAATISPGCKASFPGLHLVPRRAPSKRWLLECGREVTQVGYTKCKFPLLVEILTLPLLLSLPVFLGCACLVRQKDKCGCSNHHSKTLCIILANMLSTCHGVRTNGLNSCQGFLAWLPVVNWG